MVREVLEDDEGAGGSDQVVEWGLLDSESGGEESSVDGVSGDLVEYWARRMGATDRRFVWPTVYVIPVPSDEWELRLARRNTKTSSGTPPVRY